MAIEKMETRSLKNMARTPYGAPKTKSVVVKETDASISKEANKLKSLTMGIVSTVQSRRLTAKENSEKTKDKKNEKAASASPDLTSVGGVDTGLALIKCPSFQYAMYARNTVEDAVRQQKPISDVDMPKVDNMWSIHTGSKRQLGQSAAFIELHNPSESKVKHVYEELLSLGNFDFLSNGGQMVLDPRIKKYSGGVLTLLQVIEGPFTSSMSVAMMNISNEAKQQGTYVLMFIVCDSGVDKLNLQALCDDYIDVTTCEPDIGFDLAFAINFDGLGEMSLVGIGKSMCQIKSSKGKLIRRYNPFISSDLKTRAMWVMRRSGMTLEEIGKNFGGLHKSNVSKRLKGLPNPKDYKIAENWIDDFLESIEGNDTESSA